MTLLVLHILVSNCGDEQYILERYDSWDISYPLNFTKEAAASRMFRNAPSFVIETLQSAPVTMNYHRYGIAPSAYSTSFPVLQQFFSVLSTNVDNQYKQFVSTVEAKEYPIYGTQWHSEVPIYVLLYSNTFTICRNLNQVLPITASKVSLPILTWHTSL